MSPGFDQGFKKIQSENVLYIKHKYNKDEPIFYAPIAYPRCFIPQDKMMELCKYLYVVLEHVEFINEDVFGVNDLKLDNNSLIPVYIQDIKINIYEGKGDLTHVCQFHPYPWVDHHNKWMEIIKESENGVYSDLPSCV